MDDQDQVLRDFLGDNPDSRQLREWRGALFQRLTKLKSELETLPPEESARLRREVETLRKQIAALDAEEAVTRFVEDSVRVTLAMGAVISEAGDATDIEEEE